MKKLNKVLKNRKYICFLDFEGTQFSHEMIAFGATIATLDRKGNIKSNKRPIKFLVQPKNKVGKFVENLTGITKEQLDKVGIPFSKAMKELKHYCGLAFSKCAFMTFGTHDMRIIGQSSAYNLDSPKEIVSVIQKNYIDFQAVIAEFVKDPNGNPYSLANYLKVFNVNFVGTEHDPKDDAYNLMLLYKEFTSNKDVLLVEYLKVLGKLHHLPEPAKEALARLSDGKDVTSQEFVELVRKYLND